MTIRSGNKDYWITRRETLNGVLATLTFGTTLHVGTRSFAEDWPAKPIRAISPISAGSAADVIARTIFEQASSRLGRPIVVENRPGGEGTIGSAVVARADPDGYTILSHSAALTVVATARSNLPYDTVRDFSPVTPMARIPSVLVVAPSLNVRTVPELVAAARSRPIDYASPGAFTHLNTERFLRTADVNAQRIPFKGAPEALTEVMAGRVAFYFSPVFVALPLINSGKVVALAVTGERRTPLLPNVPTFAEVGFARADDNFWIGLFVPAKTPRAIIDRLHAETAASVKSPGVVERLSKFGAEPMTASPEQFEAMVKAQIAENAVLITAAGISAN